MNNARHTHKLLALAMGTILSGNASAASLNLANSPLFVTTSAEPNVMLLIDNSGSMDNIIWADGYDNTVTYDDWSDSDTNYYSTYGNNHLSDISKGTCADGWKEGENGVGTKKCLKLPDPAGSGNTRYAGNYLNYLFSTYANGTDLTVGTIPSETRMEVAKNASSDLITSSGIRFGISSFYGPSDHSYGHGATINAACGSTQATLNTAIGGLSASTNTPLAEALYEVTRYYRGMSSYYKDAVNHTSPIQYRCQRNFTVVITDGLPTRDTNFPNNDPDDTADATASLPNWDGLSPATAIADYPNFPQYSDGFQPDGSNADEGYALYLDDIAKFGYDIDMRTGINDNAGKSFDDPDFDIQRMETYTVGFSTDNQMLEDAAEYGNGSYYTADNADTLVSALQSAIDSAKLKSESSASAVTTNSTRLDTGVNVFQARFNSEFWTGELYSFGLDQLTGAVDLNTPLWDAQEGLPPSATGKTAAQRSIFTYYEQAGVAEGRAFLWANLTDTQVAYLNKDSSGAVDNLGSNRVDFLRGDASDEKRNGGTFRNRTVSVLGDIVNSNPVFVGIQDFGYKLLPGDEGLDYRDFRKADIYKNRTPMLYVGSNDGMLHGFNAETGDEVFAYIPSVVYPNLSGLTDPNYNHRYYVDGSPHVGDAYLNTIWKTVLLGATGAGGRSIFALDVTYPGSFDATDVMWEFTPADDADLGYTIGKPSIVRLNDGSWVALVANGYNSTNNHAVLFLLDLATGTVLHKFDTKAGDAANPNGLSTPIPVDINGDRITDVIYAGDLLGNLWKFDLDGNDTSKWGIPFNSGGAAKLPEPLFIAKDANGNTQPITVRPEVGTAPEGGELIFFGTGKYLETGDDTVPVNPQIQTFYGILDDGTQVSGRAALQEQTITHELGPNDTGLDFDVRVISDTTVNWKNQDGWFLDLKSPVLGAEGERNVTTPLLRAGRIIFTTLIPSTDPCGFGGTGWLMELDAYNGSRLTYSVFDVNGDGKVDDNDFITLADGTKVPVGGMKFDDVLSSPTVVSAGEVEHKYISGSSGTINHVTEIGDPTKGRQSWRQIQ